MTTRTVMVVGGSRGLGRGIADAARAAGARVTTVSRTAPDAGARATGSDWAQGDATDEALADKLLAEVRPGLLVITAGASPEMRPLAESTWETFSANWHADVRIAFTWLRAALRLPLAPGSRVIVFGSAAELRGSPLSGGYAGAKATVRLITGYAAGEASGIAMTTILPVVTPGTGVGETAISAYSKSAGLTEQQFRARLTAAPTPESVGAAIVGLAEIPPGELASAYLIDANGLRELDART